MEEDWEHEMPVLESAIETVVVSLDGPGSRWPTARAIASPWPAPLNLRPQGEGRKKKHRLGCL